ncbi:SDR family NAD(P)-dependent oxidoreductase [Planctomycetota bacterium]
MKLRGLNALITGGSRGLGRAVAEAFVREGASVLLCARGEQELRRAGTELAGSATSGQVVQWRRADMADTKALDDLAESALAAFGSLDVLVNNAGVLGPVARLEDGDWEEWVRALQTDLFGPVYLCRALVAHFKSRGRGKIINLSGGGATKPMPRMSAYAAAKAGLVRFTETLAEELRSDGVDVNAVAPGAMNTRFLDEVLAAGPERAGRKAYDNALKQKAEGGVSPERAAALCVFLASTESDGITGKLISAIWDPWLELAERKEELRRSDVYTLRRIVPWERDMDWGRVEG